MGNLMTMSRPLSQP